MPTIPIFDSGNNQSPGSITPATTGLATSTANLFLNEGRALAEKIEVQSSKAEAQMKAPIIATAYADGLSKISQGDFSGFSRMEEANAMTAGNPFLMKFAEGARGEATQIARNFLDDRLSQRRIDAEKDLQANRIKATSDLQSGIESRQSRHDYRMETDAWNRENEKLDQQDALAQSRENQLAAAQGRQPSVIPKTPRRPAPNPGMFDINQNDIPLPTEGAANPIQSTDQNIPTAQGATQSAQSTAQPTAQPTGSAPLKLTFGGQEFIAPSIPGANVSLTSIKGPYGETYKVADNADAVAKAKVEAFNKAKELAGKLEGADAGFAKWSADMLSRGYTIQLDTSNKDKITASAENPNAPKELQKTYYTTDLVIPADPNKKTPEIDRKAGAPDAQQIPINNDVRKLWPDLTSNVKQAGITVSPQQPKSQQVLNITDEAKQKVLSGLVARANENPAALDYFKSQAEKAGLDPELIKVTPKVDQKVVQANEADKVLQDQGVNVEKIKQQEEQQKARIELDKKKNLAEKTVENSKSAIKDLEFRISLLEKDLEQMKNEKAPLADMRFKASEIKRHQDQIDEEQKRLSQANNFLTGR